MDAVRERELLDRLGAPPAGRFAEVNGFELYYEVHGAGAPLLLLHGFTQAGVAWQPYLPAFTGSYRVIVPDLRGHGRSTNPSGKFTHRQSAEDVAALLDHLDIDRCCALGFSTGGMTLLHLATRRPERIERMIVISSTSYYPEQARAIMRDLDPDRLRDEANDELRKIHHRGEEQVYALRRQFHEFKDSYEDMNFTGPLLATIQAPTLIVHGDRDDFFEVGIPVEMYRAIPDSYLWIVPNGGHGLLRELSRDDAGSFRRAALAFLRGAWAASSDG